MMNIARWQALMDKFGFAPNVDMFHRLITLHAEKHRAYHTSEHISACFKHLDKVSTLANSPHEIELALWFHDAIYKLFSATNEQDSANMATAFLRANAADGKLTMRIERLILLTKDHMKTHGPDEQLMIDIDLSILGAPPHIYDQYEIDIRREYKRVPGFIFKKKRCEILKGFLKRPRLYQHDHLHRLWDEQARQNLKRAIKTYR